jgi:CrcB protein
MTGIIAIALGGSIGAVCRWLIAEYLRVPKGGFPYAIMVVNVLGSFALGIFVGAELGAAVPFDTATVSAGILGGFTTFSTWMVDIDEAESRSMALGIVVVPLTLGLCAAGVGIYVGGRIV